MKYLVCLCALIVVAVAFPQREGQQFTNEAIRQAQDSYLIPRDAQIQDVSTYYTSAQRPNLLAIVLFLILYRYEKALNWPLTNRFPAVNASICLRSWAIKCHPRSLITCRAKSTKLAKTNNLLYFYL